MIMVIIIITIRKGYIAFILIIAVQIYYFLLPSTIKIEAKIKRIANIKYY
jgi:hypothetical protein